MMKRRFFYILLSMSMLFSLGAIKDSSAQAQPAIQNLSNASAPQAIIPEAIGQIGGVTKSVAMVGNLAYIGIGPRLAILDVSDPSKPGYLGHSGILPKIIEEVWVAGNYAYIADGFGGLRIIDITTTASPIEVGFIGTSSSTYDVNVVGNYAYVADGESGLRIIDISKPSSLVEVGAYDTPGYAQGVTVVGDYAYVADSSTGLRIIDITVPNAPVEVGFYSPEGILTYVDVAVVNNYAYVVGGIYENETEAGGLVIIDISNPTTPVEAGYCFTVSYGAEIIIVGSYAYVPEGSAGLEIIDTSNPGDPSSVGFYDSPGSAGDVAVEGKYAYVADYTRGMRSIDITNPSFPVEAGSYEESGIPYGVTVAYDYAYIAYGSNGVAIVDVSNPGVLTKVGFYDTPGFARDVRVLYGYAYVVDEDSGLRIIDISNPESPVESSYYDTPGTAYSLDIAGDYVYVADRESGLRIIDISNPEVPVEIGCYDTPGDAWQVDVEGNYAYVADHYQGLRIIDISNPAAPFEVGYYKRPQETYFIAVDVWADYAYVAVSGPYGGELLIIDIRDPRTPIEVGNLFISTNNLVVSGNYVYIPSDLAGFYIYNISQPSHPVEVGYYDTPGYSNYAWLVGNKAYIADEDGGIIILRMLTDKVTSTIPIIGGSLASTDGDTHLTFGSGAFTDTVQVTYQHLLYDERIGYWAGTSETFELSAIYSGTQEGANIAPGQTFTITVTYSDSQIGPALEDTLGLFSWNGTSWVREPTSKLDPVNNTIVATPNHLSLWAILGETNRVYMPVMRE